MSKASISKNKNYKNITAILLIGLVGVVATFFGINVIFSVDGGEVKLTLGTTIEYADDKDKVSTVLETADGQVEITDEPATVNFVDSGLIEGCPEDEECGQGAYVYVPTDTYTDFYNYTLGKCIDVDGYYGAQCWDLGAAFWMNYTEDGRTLSTCGTGGAKGAWLCKEQNAGTEFELITDTHSLQAGDWIIFNNGIYGHVGMALGGYNNNYIALLGQNQGGPWCAGGGSATNVINMSLTSFAGAFRPKTYIKPEPTPEPQPTGNYVYQKGDYFSAVLVKLGLSDGKNLWGINGDVNFYNEQLKNQGILEYRDGKYWNNIPIGTEIHLEAR